MWSARDSVPAFVSRCKVVFRNTNMNKLFIVVLAVCLISVNSALVKREAETPSPNYVDDIQKKLQEFGKTVQDQISGALNPEQIKKTFNEGIDNLSKMFENGKQGAPKQ